MRIKAAAPLNVIFHARHSRRVYDDAVAERSTAGHRTTFITESVNPREYTRLERLADGVVHATGIVLSATGAVVLLHAVIPKGGTASVAAASLYGFSLVAVLWLSAIYNLLTHPVWKERARPFDHAAIFLLIAGTYTPFLLVGIAGGVGYTLLAIVWILAIAGVVLKLLHPRRWDRLFVAFYLALGWIGFPTAGLIIASLPASALALLVMGGLLYTGGVAFHLWERLPYQNAIWHAFVLVGASCHFFAVLDTLGGQH
jgi:hemolysin III